MPNTFVTPEWVKREGSLLFFEMFGIKREVFAAVPTDVLEEAATAAAHDLNGDEDERDA
jgi:hypothetical protein